MIFNILIFIFFLKRNLIILAFVISINFREEGTLRPGVREKFQGLWPYIGLKTRFSRSLNVVLSFVCKICTGFITMQIIYRVKNGMVRRQSPYENSKGGPFILRDLMSQSLRMNRLPGTQEHHTKVLLDM